MVAKYTKIIAGPLLNFEKRAYWWEIGEALKPTQELDTLPANTDFVVIGAGYAGLSAALTVARRGKSVIVVDGGMPGFGASTRNGEFVVDKFDLR